MISVTEAFSLVERETRRMLRRRRRIEKIPLAEGLGRVLARPLSSRFDVPRFDNSAMDGFAFRSVDTKGASKKSPAPLRIVGTVAAGDQDHGKGMKSGRAIRIMTGAPTPTGTDTVVKKEDVIEQGDNVLLFKEADRGQNIRRRGEDIRSGQRAVTSGTKITPGVAAFLASVGIETIPVLRTPSVSLIVTGNELIARGNGAGRIPDSNSLFLSLALREMGLTPRRIETIGDNPDTLKKVFEKSLDDSDLVIVTGGVSVGEHDYTKEVLAVCGVKTLFWKVAQKPGKPLFLGKKKQSLVFGLPGNPYAVVVCFYLYIRPAVRLLMGGKKETDFSGAARLDHEVVKSDDKVHFLKGTAVSGNGDLRVRALAKQGSHLLSAMTRADLLIEIPAAARRMRAGEKVRIHFL